MPVDPAVWASVPFRNKTAWADFTGTLELWMRALAQRIFQSTGQSIVVLPLGDGGGPEWLSGVQTQFEDAAVALGIAAPGDLESYNLDQAGDFSSWTWQVSNEARRLRSAAGLP
jgi:hypothetical protein